MSFLLDTNALSEPQRPLPNDGFMRWLRSLRASDLHMSVLTAGELRSGIIGLEPGRRRSTLEAWLAETAAAFGPRVLAVDNRVAKTWSEVRLAYRRSGLQSGVVDELIAATALAHDLTVVTRNVRHYEGSGCRILSPWTDG